MTFSCDKNLILEAVNNAIRTVPSKSSLPVLEGLLLHVCDDGSLRIIGSDAEMFIETKIDVESVVNVSFVVSAKLFFDMLTKLENGSVFFDLDDKGILNIFSGVIKYKLPTMDASLYPVVPEIERSESLCMKKSVLASMLRQTLYSVAVKETRPVLRGELFDIRKNSISIVSSDTFRMAVRTEFFEEEREKEFSFIVPGKALSEVAKIMKNDEENVYIGVASTHVVFEFDNTRIVSRLIAGDFLRYQTMIPKTFKTSILIHTEELKKSIERASVLINDKVKNPVRVRFEFDTIVVSYKTPDGSSMTDEIKAHIEGDNFEIGFNDKFIMDALNACEVPEIVLNLNSPVASLCIKPKDSEKFIFLLSPMKLKD